MATKAFSVASMSARTIMHTGSHRNKSTWLTQTLNSAMLNCLATRSYTVNQLTKNMHLITLDNDSTNLKNFKDDQVIRKETKPLVIILAWLLSKPKHLKKFTNFYTDRGYDVLTVRVTAWQALWPVKGNQVVAGELIEFLENHPCYGPLLLHGFSVGGHLWGEVCVKLDSQAGKEASPLVNRFVGQIWDSVANFREIEKVPEATFPDHTLMSSAASKYLRFHLQMFQEAVTFPYIRSIEMFHNNLLKAPALFLVSKSDEVGKMQINMQIHDRWKKAGVQTYWKCWEESPHVRHFQSHPEEYAAELCSFLNRVGLNHTVRNTVKVAKVTLLQGHHV